MLNICYGIKEIEVSIYDMGCRSLLVWIDMCGKIRRNGWKRGMWGFGGL